MSNNFWYQRFPAVSRYLGGKGPVVDWKLILQPHLMKTALGSNLKRNGTVTLTWNKFSCL